MKNNGVKRKVNGNSINLNERANENISLINLDFSNAIAFIGNDDKSTFDFLYKIKVAINLLFDEQAFMELIRHSVVNYEKGKRFVLGNSSLHNFIVTSLIANNDDDESYVIILKYIQKINELQNEPGTINTITLKRFKINDLSWENKAEISFMNSKGNEYSMKISFFNRN
jgi:hypothetical protein